MAPGVPQRMVPPNLSWQVGAAKEGEEAKSIAVATAAKINGRIGAAFQARADTDYIQQRGLRLVSKRVRVRLQIGASGHKDPVNRL